MSTAVALRFVCNAGSATLTTVPSMNAMLEARIVAARTQRPLDFGQGADGGRDRITFSSQGSRKTPHIFATYHRREVAGFSNLIFSERVVRITVEPMLAGLRGSDHWMASSLCVFTSMRIW